MLLIVPYKSINEEIIFWMREYYTPYDFIQRLSTFTHRLFCGEMN